MPTKSKPRSLPKDRNPLLQEPDDRTPLCVNIANAEIDESLVRKCKVQEVLFDAFSVNVIRLKLPVPASPDSESIGGQRFITRMNDTDYFQALSMYSRSNFWSTRLTTGLKLHSRLPRRRIRMQKKRSSRRITPSYMMQRSKDFG